MTSILVQKMMFLETATYVMFYFVVVVIDRVKGVEIRFVIPIDVQKTVVMGHFVMSVTKKNLVQNHSPQNSCHPIIGAKD